MTLPTPSSPSSQNLQNPSIFLRVKTFFSKYYNGLKLIHSRYPQYRNLKSKPLNSLSRKEYQLISQMQRDLRILAPFCISLLLIPEIIPIFVIRGYVPSTCLSGEEIEKGRTKLLETRRNITKTVIAQKSIDPTFTPASLRNIPAISTISRKYPGDFALSNLGRPQLKFYCRFMGLGGWGFKWMTKRRLEKWFDEVRVEDMKIMQEGVERLGHDDLIQAVEKRGISLSHPLNVPLTSPQQYHLRSLLNDWITMNITMDGQIEKGLLVFSRIGTMSWIMAREGIQKK